MNDITKARFFLGQRGSKLRELETFQLMLATAEKKYRDIKLRKASRMDIPGTWEMQEVEAGIDYSILRYLKKYNQLPPNAVEALKPETTLERKKELIISWYSA